MWEHLAEEHQTVSDGPCQPMGGILTPVPAVHSSSLERNLRATQCEPGPCAPWRNSRGDGRDGALAVLIRGLVNDLEQRTT